MTWLGFFIIVIPFLYSIMVTIAYLNRRDDHKRVRHMLRIEEEERGQAEEVIWYQKRLVSNLQSTLKEFKHVQEGEKPHPF